VTASTGALRNLEREHPEWTPWLAVVEPVLAELRNRDWDGPVPDGLNWTEPGVPLLRRAMLSLDTDALASLFEVLLSQAGERMPIGPDKTVAVFEAALNHDDARLNSLAAEVNIDSERFHAIAALLSMPFLHACNRRWGIAAPENWTSGYCVICGAWPAFAEECGVDRVRYLRCGRCGAAWQALRLCCPYCGMTEHASLASLVVEQSKAAIEVCKRCTGYVKVFTVLRPAPPSDVLYEDLASVTLDLAASARGYRRPERPGCVLHATATAAGEAMARRNP
jgi:formate dehydrogenase accessory protein FdhE